MAWYDTGTVSVTNGSTTVTGAGTNFVAGVQVGEGFSGPDGRIYEIQAVVSATSLTLADPYLSSTQTGQDYKIVPTQSLVANLASQVSTLISDFQGVVDEAGAGKFDDGTAASAGITFLQDQDTGFFRPAANQIGMTTAGVQRALLTSTGLNSTVIGATTPASGTFTTITATGSVTAGGDMFITGPTPALKLTDNDEANEWTKLENASGTTVIDSRNGASNGAVLFRGVGGGVVDEYARFKPDGHFGIGTANPTSTLHVSGTTSAGGILVEDSNEASASPSVSVIGKRSDSNGSQAFSGKLLLAGNRTDAAVSIGKKIGTVSFGGNHTDGSQANILYAASISGVSEGTFSNLATMPTALAFYTGTTGRNPDVGNVSVGSERMRIDSVGRAIIPAGVTLGTSVGVYNAAKTLDDYEEGIWIPDLEGSTTDPTYTHVSKFTKIGNLVTVNTSITFITAGSGNYSIPAASLPFVRNGNFITGTVSVLDAGTSWYVGVARADNVSIVFYVNDHQQFGSGAPFTVTSNDKLNVTITYFTTQ